MLSKFIYRLLTVALLALSTQVGISQNYVGADEALEILTDAIDHLQTEIDNGPVETGYLQSLSSFDNDKIDLQLMKTVKNEIDAEKDVKIVMDGWYEKADAEVTERKTKLILALDKVKQLLS
jgi:hypothetical protein